MKVTYDEETEEWNICRTSTLFYQIIKLRSVDFKFKLDTEFDEVNNKYLMLFTEFRTELELTYEVTFTFSLAPGYPRQKRREVDCDCGG